MKREFWQKMSKEPGNCKNCGRELKKNRNTGKYVYYVCHPCKHQRNPATRKYTRDYNFKKRGVSSEWYDKIFAEQEGKCAICRNPETAMRDGLLRALNVDHDHRCCKWGCIKCIRGLLCTTCNKGIGHLMEDIKIMENAIKYVTFYHEKLNDLTVSE